MLVLVAKDVNRIMSTFHFFPVSDDRADQIKMETICCHFPTGCGETLSERSKTIASDEDAAFRASDLPECKVCQRQSVYAPKFTSIRALGSSGDNTSRSDEFRTRFVGNDPLHSPEIVVGEK